MFRTRTLATSVVALLAVMGASSCGDSYDRAEFVEELSADGQISVQQAECIADRVEDEIGVDRLNSRGSDLTEEETGILTAATIDCVLGGG